MSDTRCPICRELPLKCEHTMQEILDAEDVDGHDEHYRRWLEELEYQEADE